MQALLQQHFGFAPGNIVVMRDDVQGIHPTRIPTKANMIAAMQQFMAGVQAGDSLFFHFSGHGTQCADLDGDEASSLRELWQLLLMVCMLRRSKPNTSIQKVRD